MRSMRRRMSGSSQDRARCAEALKNLDAYLDREIRDEALAQRISDHLDVCKDCGMEARTLAKLKASLRRLAPPVDPGTLDRLRSFARDLEDRGLDE